MNRRQWQTIILWLISLVPFGLGAQGIAEFESLSARADSLYEARAYDAAIDLKRDLIRRYAKWDLPAVDIVDLHIDISRIYRTKGDYPNTLRYLQEAIRVGEERLSPNEPELARAYNGLGIYHYLQRDPNQALDAFRAAYEIRLQAFGPEDPLVADMYNNIAICHEQLEDYPRALENYRRALQIRTEHFGECDGSVADSYLNIGTTWHRWGDFRRALDYYHLAREIYVVDTEKYGADLVHLLNNMGVCYQDRGDYPAAEILLEEALQTNRILHGPDHPEVAFSLNNLGLNYFDLGDYNKALVFFRRALDIRQRKLEPGHPLIAGIYNHMASCYLQKKDYEQAYRLAKRALHMRLDHYGQRNTDVADSYSDLGLYYESTDQLDSAEVNYRSALAIYRQQLGDNHPLVGDTRFRLGNCYLELNDRQKARQEFAAALDIRRQVLGEDHPLTAQVLAGLARAAETPQRGLPLLNDAYQVLAGPDSIRESSLWSVHPGVALEVLTARSRLLYSLQRLDWDRTRLEEIRDVNDCGLQWIDMAMRVYQEPGSRQLLLDRFYRLLELDMENCADGIRHTGDQLWTERSFMIAERGKGILLRESAARVQARSFAGVPDSLHQREQELLLDITALERRIFQAPDSLRQPLRSELFALKKEQYDLLRLFKVNYPEYYQLRYAVWKFDPEPLQRFSRTRAVNVLQYFQGDRNAYVLLLNADTILLHQVGTTPLLVERINRFRSQLTDVGSLHDPSPSRPVSYAREGKALYESLIQPLEPHFRGDRLVVIPDGVLYYLPFDGLVSQAAPPDADWKQLDYLVHSYAISYAYTADMLVENAHSQMEVGTRLLAVAPAFPAGGMLPPLRYNQEEVEAVSDRWRGRVLSGPAATKADFLKHASGYGLLHLATHAAANDTLGRYSFLAFQPDTGKAESNLLYVRELYNLQLPAELVVLSACETGVGEWQRGEGLISLGRGFFYAGSHSLLTSLWKLDDASSSILMGEFYGSLHEGDSKDVALQRAKRSYLRTNSALRGHPYYWASFVPVGNMDPIDPPGLPIWVWILGSVAVLGLISALGWNIRKQWKSKN